MIGLLLALLAGAAAVEGGAVSRPAWLQRPTGQDIARVTPSLERLPPEVSLVMVCRIRADGGLEACSVRDETPPGLGYAAAALALAPYFRMPAVDLDGRPVAGRMVQIPLLWKNSAE